MYVTADNKSFLVGLCIDPDTGQLHLVEDYQDNIDGIDSLENSPAVHGAFDLCGGDSQPE